MLITGPEGYLPILNKTVRAPATGAAARSCRIDGRYDNYTASAGASQETSFRDAVATLAYQVRTNTTTGKIQELRRQVSAGEYQISPREVAARMLLMEEGE